MGTVNNMTKPDLYYDIAQEAYLFFKLHRISKLTKNEAFYHMDSMLTKRGVGVAISALDKENVCGKFIIDGNVSPTFDGKNLEALPKWAFEIYSLWDKGFIK